MNKIRIERRLPSADDFGALRAAAGWGLPSREAVHRGLAGSLYGVSVVDDDVVVGTGRVIGDGGFMYVVADVIVAPEYRGRGIGTAIMHRLMDFVKGDADEGAVVGVMAARGVEGFYERFGFVRRPSPFYGAGMSVPPEVVATWAGRRDSALQ